MFKLREFVEPGTQVVLGNRHMPKKVVSGPCHIYPIGRRIHGEISTAPQWFSITSNELLTATQIPVIVHVDCQWARNLENVPNDVLPSATRVTNSRMESILKSNLKQIAKDFVVQRPAEELVPTPQPDETQLKKINRNRSRLAERVSHEIKSRLGKLGVKILRLKVYVSLPERLQQEVEDTWRLRYHQGSMEALTDLRLAQALGKGHQAINLLMGSQRNSFRDQDLSKRTESLPVIEPAEENNGTHTIEPPL